MSKTTNSMWDRIKAQYKVFKEYQIKNDANIPVPREILEARLEAEQSSKMDPFTPAQRSVIVRDLEEESISGEPERGKQPIKGGEIAKERRARKTEINGYLEQSIRIEVDQETVASPRKTKEIKVKSPEESKSSGIWLNINELMRPMQRMRKRGKSKKKKSFYSDYNGNLTRKIKRRKTLPFNPKNAINVDDEQPPLPVPSEEGEPLYIWPEPPKVKIINLEPKKEAKEAVERVRMKKDSRADLRKLAEGFELMKMHPRALETIKYISANKYKLTKNCQPEVFVKDLRCLGSYDHDLSMQNRFKYLKNVISCEEKTKRKPAKKTKKVRKKAKKERKFTVKMQNLYIS